MGKERHLSSEALELLMTNDWPGKVRELKNALESAAVLTDKKILPSNLPFSLKRNESHIGSTFHSNETIVDANGNGADLDLQIKNYERRIIVEALRRSGGVQVKAAAILSIKERSLWHLKKKTIRSISRNSKHNRGNRPTKSGGCVYTQCRICFSKKNDLRNSQR